MKIFYSDDFTFVVGASCWDCGQLESEVARGYWLPCTGPPAIAMNGYCDHNAILAEEERSSLKIEPDLWLSMMCALSSQEARLAKLLLDEVQNENDHACDDLR